MHWSVKFLLIPKNFLVWPLDFELLFVPLHPQISEWGRSPVGLERCSHIAEVNSSSLFVPTNMLTGK